MASDIPSTFEQTLQTSKLWIDDVRGALGDCDEHQAHHALCATLQTLRDRLPVNEAVQLGAQLPVLLRGLYYEGWRPSETPVRLRTRDDFVSRVGDRYHTAPLPDLEEAVTAVFATIADHVSPGETRSIIRVLPEELRELWPAPFVDAVASPEQRPPARDDDEAPYVV